MKNVNYLRRSSFWVGTLAIMGLFLLALPNSDMFAAPMKRNVSFDHIRTGFPLTGAHVTLPCETCHGQGTFKGTPKRCETCHTRGGRVQTTTFKPNNHIATTQACDQCHRSTASWNVVIFSHVGVIPHQCAQCHNGAIVAGKPAKHTPTTAPCDSCHRTTTWMSAGFDHIGVAPGSCATCHVPGGSGMAKPTNHIPTTLSCDACHNTSTYTTSTFTHSAIQGVLPGQCANCHNGSYATWNALGKPSGHVSTMASCDTCHTGFQSFVTSTFDHSGVSPGSCATCHVQGGSGMAKPTSHIPTNLSCDACHSTGGTFTTSTFTHSAAQGVVPGQCANCHNGSYATWNALGKPSGHVSTMASCDSCHTAGYSTFAGAGFNHTGVAPGSCATCHVQGGAGMAKPTNHIPTNLSCDACHNTSTFTTSTFTHSATQGVLPGQCATSGCHSGAYTAWNALGQSSGHVTTSASCDSCHTAGYSTFAGAGFNHTGVAPGSCATCHVQGGSGMAKPTSHIPTNLSCDACHSTGGTFTTSTFTHSAAQGVVPGQCANCHNGSYATWNAQAKPANHIPTSTSCDACHATGGTFTTSTFNHSATQGVLPGQCATCHNGAYTQWNAQGKPNDHPATNASCDQCHNTRTFSN